MIKKIWNFLKPILELISKLVSSVINFFLLSAVYFFGVGLVAIPMKIFGTHFLELKRQNKKTNWREHKVEKQPLESYYRTF